MQLVVPVDVADVVQAWLNSAEVSSCAEPLPYDLASSLPITLVQPIGGIRGDVVRDSFSVRLYTWASDEAASAVESSRAVAALQAMERQQVGGVFCRSVSINALPYPAHDPEHPDLKRMCFTARVGLSSSVVEP